MKKIVYLLLVTSTIASAQNAFTTKDIEINALLKGSMFMPIKPNAKTDLVILLSGSGPTDKNGNQKGIENNSLLYLSEALANNNIAAFSFDKRTVVLSKDKTANEQDMKFDDLINDTKDVITYFKNKKQFRRIIIAGHSEGSLVGMVASLGTADAFISIAGPGKSIDETIVEQITKQAPTLKEEVVSGMESLKKGVTFEPKNPMLASIFRPSVQPYMISWIKFNPSIEIKKLKIPVLLINGTKDLQVTVTDAELLKAAKPDAQIEIITNMNHVFKNIKTDDTAENIASYSNPATENIPELIFVINRFIKSL